jgi:hypothetical protein
MQTKVYTFLGLAAAGLAVLTLAGCLFGTEKIGTGDSVRTWHGGKLSRTYPVEFDRVWKAAAGAVHEMKLNVEQEQADALVGRIKARRADDIVVRVDVDNVGEKLTNVVIWVGAIGTERDKLSAMAVMDAMDKKLGR